MTITTSGFDGVEVVGPADSRFDVLIESLAAPGWAPVIKDAVPSVVIVMNDSDRKIVAMSTVFEVNAGVRAGRNSVCFVAPDAIASSDLEYGRASSKGVAPGAGKMIGFNFAVPDRTRSTKFTQDELDFYDPQTRNWIQSIAAELVTADAVHVTLDAVIFVDGVMLGDGTSRLSSHFDALVQEKQRVYRSLREGIDAGESADALVRQLMSEAPAMPDELSTDWYAANEARNTVCDLLRNYGPQAFRDVLDRAALPQPFVIHRGGL